MDAVVQRAIDAARAAGALATKTAEETVDTGKFVWEMPRDRVLRLMDEAVEAARKAREDAAALTLAQAIQAAKDAEVAASKSKGLVEGVVDFIGGFVNDAGKFLSDGVKGLVGGAVDAVNWLTDMILHPDRFITWLSDILAAAW
ncbi:unnamed protein product [marine sediment metagenome]|uniref:Uncharacterized protein n=1 Tax=marine sediment metagenome TaxID=412755 RepID=X1M9L2_9ZZZZ